MIGGSFPRDGAACAASSMIGGGRPPAGAACALEPLIIGESEGVSSVAEATTAAPAPAPFAPRGPAKPARANTTAPPEITTARFLLISCSVRRYRRRNRRLGRRAGTALKRR